MRTQRKSRRSLAVWPVRKYTLEGTGAPVGTVTVIVPVTLSLSTLKVGRAVVGAPLATESTKARTDSRTSGMAVARECSELGAISRCDSPGMAVVQELLSAVQSNCINSSSLEQIANLGRRASCFA
ncbi:hypothetical protein Ctob_009414 [Chrysochromulina tobinii]|uniref:Uncharacterized protein n=1 Tax=Chrysochromulina tobinii TaxID=1460289 RepID=A0A0M0KA95_9EUKA|nr:hypothetical protein Ctob_009414 [Chrysochromulina tobinii]|eukprot:KOO35719.1 hypothetical protein Ctob_009414 [Chrysochromulina sp. CCMP291]